MKKTKLFAASIAAMALVGCTSEDYVGVVDNPTGDGIGFGSGVTATTRANSTGSQAAEKLNNNFIVYGFKTNTAESEDQVVFDRYNVNYEAGTANTTESNTADWEYVGLANHDGSINPQTIKYWDFSRDKYVFSAVSGTGITAKKTTTGSTIYDKGWEVEIPAGGDISTLYASDRVVATKDGSPLADGNKVEGKYKETVKLTFRSLITKIRFAMYETVPGYEVHIDKFYYKDASWANTETNFAIDGTFKTANATTSTPLKITYYNKESGIENRPKVSYDDEKVTTAKYGIFGANIQATPAIGTTSASATYDQSDKSYTLILPYESSALSTPADNNLELYVDYTLKSTDGSGETIKVWHASAKVPTNFTQWKPNFAYTYIFKISNNTNGTTDTPPSGDDKDNPETTPDPEKVGLFPITFDAVVITDETDVQETITSVSDPSITTYQEGVVVTANDEYVAGDIYFESLTGSATTSDVSGYHVYEVNNYGSEATTEEVVANWLKNFCVLTEVVVTKSTGSEPTDFIPLSNGTYLKKKANEAAKFTAVAGKTYVIVSGEAKDLDPTASKAQCKVVKVAGTAAAVSYTVGSDATIDAVDGTATITVKQGTVGVLGAVPCFTVTGAAGNTALKITDGANAGEYTVSVDAAAIAAGKANGTYTVSFDGNDVTITVNIANSLTSSVTIVAGNTTGANASLTIGGAAADGDVTDVPDGITIEKTAPGTYKVTAAATVAPGTYTAKIAGVDLTINVDGYTFLDSRTFTLDYTGNADQQTLFLTKNVTEYADVEVSDMTGIDEDVAKIIKADAGIYAVVPMGPGSYTVTYENASAVITVNQFTLTSSAASIAKSTGSAVLTLTKNNGETKTVNASTAKVTVKKGDTVVTTGFSLTSNGQTMKFGNVTTTGTYTFEYTEDAKVVAVATVTVTE